MNDKKYSLRPYLLAYKWHYAIGIFVLLAVDLANLYIPQFIEIGRASCRERVSLGV